MCGAGTLSILLTYAASFGTADPSKDFAQFKRAQDMFVAANVRGDFAAVEPYYSPKFVYMRGEGMIMRDELLNRIKSQFGSRIPLVSGEAKFKSVVPEMNGFAVHVKRHYVTAEATMTIGTGSLHHYTELKESWVFQSGRWMINSTQFVDRKSEWHMRDHTIVDVTYRR